MFSQIIRRLYKFPIESKRYGWFFRGMFYSGMNIWNTINSLTSCFCIPIFFTVILINDLNNLMSGIHRNIKSRLTKFMAHPESKHKSWLFPFRMHLILVVIYPGFFIFVDFWSNQRFRNKFFRIDGTGLFHLKQMHDFSIFPINVLLVNAYRRLVSAGRNWLLPRLW